MMVSILMCTITFIKDYAMVMNKSYTTFKISNAGKCMCFLLYNTINPSPIICIAEFK